MKKCLKTVIASSLVALSLVTTVIPSTTYAGIRSDGVTASNHAVKSNDYGNYAWGYVTMTTYHTTTAKLYYKGDEVASGANSGSGKVTATSSYYTAHGTNLSSKVFYK